MANSNGMLYLNAQYLLGIPAWYLFFVEITMKEVMKM